jgi:F-type H+-transporting ATPase subunit b
MRKTLLFTIFLLVFTKAALASGGGGEVGGEFIWHSINFLLLLVLLYWLLADKIKKFFVSRREELKESIERAEGDKREAQEKYLEYVDKIEKASGEIDKIAEAIRAQGLAERDKIVAEALKIAEKVREDAKSRMEQEYKEASAKLRKEAVSLSVAMAEEILRRNIKQEDNEAIVQEYIEKVVLKQ